MSSENKAIAKISDICIDVSYGYTASADDKPVGPKFLRITDIQGGIVQWKNVPYCDIDNKNKKKYLLKTGDIVVARTGNSTGENFIYFGDDEVVFASYLIRFRIDEKIADPFFVWYQMRTQDWWNFIISSKTGSAQAGANAKLIGTYKIYLPHIEAQHKIASFLKSLDDRIALLRETNATLESIAQAIFKSWFIDFDPVKAKKQGLEPQGMDAATAALFPDAFQDSELGPIPAGWEVLSLGELVRTVGGGTPSTKDISYWQPAEFAWTTPKDLSAQDSPVLLKTERMISAKGVEKLSSGLLPKGTLLLSSRAPIGYLAIAGIPLCINQGYIAMLPDSILPPLYMLFWCKNNMELIKNRSNGSTFMEISKKSFRGISAIKPSDVLLKCFTDLITPVFDRIVENEQKSQTLASIRDTLLPRLISGRLRVPEAEAMAVEAGL